MKSLFLTGFESGDIAATEISAHAGYGVIDSDGPRTGTYHAWTTNTGANRYITLITALAATRVRVGFGHKRDAHPTAEATLVECRDASANPLIKVQLETDGTIEIEDAIGQTWATSTIAPTINAWHYYEVFFEVGYPARCRVYVDGSKEALVEATLVGVELPNIDRIVLGPCDPASGSSENWYWDDVDVAIQIGADWRPWRVGEASIPVKRPMANYFSSGSWCEHGGGAATYADWDDTGLGDDDATYNYTKTSVGVLSFINEFEDQATDEVAAVKVTARGKLNSTSTPGRGEAAMIRSGTTVNVAGTYVDYTSGYAYYHDLFIRGATSASAAEDWSRASYNEMRIGIRKNLYHIRVTQVFAQLLVIAAIAPKLSQPISMGAYSSIGVDASLTRSVEHIVKTVVAETHVINVRMTAGVATATASAPVAAAAGGAALAGTTATATGTSPASALSGGAGFTAGVTTATATAPSATIAGGAALGAGVATADAISPVAALSVNVYLTAAVTMATASAPVATAIGGALLTAGVAAASAQSPAASLSETVSGTFLAEVGTATATSPASTVTGGAALVGVVNTASADTPAATVTGGAALAGVVSLATAFAPAAALGISVTLAASPAIATATAPSATATGGANLTAGLATATAQGPAAVLSGTVSGTLTAVVTTATTSALVAALSVSVTLTAVVASASTQAPAAGVTGGGSLLVTISLASIQALVSGLSGGACLLAGTALATALAPAATIEGAIVGGHPYYLGKDPWSSLGLGVQKHTYS